MNVLVTGATGFVGGHLVDRLLERGDRITALVRSPARAHSLAQHGVQLINGDLADQSALAAAVDDQDAVIHVAAMLGAPTEAALMTANRDGTANVVRACAALPRPPRLVFVSSMAAGGPAEHGLPKITDDHDQPVTMYGRSKLASEQSVRAYRGEWCIVRPPVVYGPRDREAMLPLFKAVRFGVAPMFGDGSMEVCFVHVNDLVHALILAATDPDVAGRLFYVNHPEIVTADYLMRTVARVANRSAVPIPLPAWAARAALTVTGAWATLFGQKSILHPDKVNEFYQPAWTADPSPFIGATGWNPQWPLSAGLPDTLAWYRQERWL